MNLTVRVRATFDRYSFDGQTGLVVLKGMTGRVTGLTLSKNPTQPQREPRPLLTVAWDAAVMQDKDGNEFDIVDTWEEADINPNELEAQE
jgi:hypothetical protein